MSSITARVNNIRQPSGGIVPLSLFDEHVLQDGDFLYPDENIKPSIMNLVVECLLRFSTGVAVNDAFDTSVLGAERAEGYYVTSNRRIGVKNAKQIASELLSEIHGLDDASIISASKLVTFDIWARNMTVEFRMNPHDMIEPDEHTLKNIRTMVKRCCCFFDEFGPIVKNKFSFESYGYSSVIDSGVGEYMSDDAFLNIRVAKNKPSVKHTLQSLVYYVMSHHSGQDIYDNIKKICIFNPRTNIIYTLSTDDIPIDTISKVETDVICYHG